MLRLIWIQGISKIILILQVEFCKTALQNLKDVYTYHMEAQALK